MSPAALALREPFDQSAVNDAPTKDAKVIKLFKSVHPNAAKLAEQYAAQKAIMEYNMANGIKVSGYDPSAMSVPFYGPSLRK